MRIYEFAKQYNLTSKELIDFLKKEGFAVGNHMSVLTEKEIGILHKKYTKSAPDEAAAKSATSNNEAKKLNTQKVPVAEQVAPEAPKQHKEESPSEDQLAVESTKSLNQSSRSSQSVEKMAPLKDNSNVKPQSDAKDALLLVPMSVMVLAQKINKPISDIILFLLKAGIVITKNQIMPQDAVAKVAAHFGIEVSKNNPAAKAESIDHDHLLLAADHSVVNTKERLPIVVVLGHVDHGKTTLLDFIRKTRVALKEKGGITQHIGAYQASTKKGDIVFIDTPGHEAFTRIRQRGIKVADIAIIVVAADDGVMPQTVEAIKLALAMNVTIIVAINKMDKADASRLDVIKRQLTQYGLVPEEWGGDIICVPISAKTGAGVDQLLDMIVLQSQMMELKANSSVNGRGYILESKVERGRGIVATLICQQGTITRGDYFICGSTTGHITSLMDSYGQVKSSVGPSIPVQITGFDNAPQVGDFFKVASREEFRKIKSEQEREIKSKNIQYNNIPEENSLNLVIKADTDSSKEALSDNISSLSKKVDRAINIVSVGVGNINESDIELAYTTRASIIAFHLRTPTNILTVANNRAVPVLQFDIIYKLLEYLQERIKINKVVPLVRKKIGQATVLRVFDIKGVGSIAGCIVNEGRFVKDGEVIILRARRKVGEGAIKSLQREKRTVKEVNSGFECGFMVDGFSDWQVDDAVECYALESDSKK